MHFTRLECSEAVAEKLWDKHGVDLSEVDEMLAGQLHVRRGRDDLHYVFGRTEAGRYLFVVLRYLGQGAARLVTARDMDGAERRAYHNR